MYKNISITNGIGIYYSHLLRKLPKPRCNIPKVLETNPSIFENTELYSICDCKHYCKYFSSTSRNTSLSSKIYHNNPSQKIIQKKCNKKNCDKSKFEFCQ